MKRILLFGLCFGLSFVSMAQTCPPEWSPYTSANYLYDLQSDYNNRGLSDTDFKNYLLNVARTNLAKQVRMRVTDEANLYKQAVGGRSQINYSSSTQFSTDVSLQLVNTKTLYRPDTKEYFALVYIDKSEACRHYRNEIERILSKVDNALTTANNYVQSGFKEKARGEMNAVLPEFSRTEEPFFWLSFFGTSRSDLQTLNDQCNTREQAVKQMLADLKHSTSICLSCTADLFGSSYATLQNELKGKLSAGGCQFTSDETAADYVIRVEASAREYNIAVFGSHTSYFAYADARITIDKRGAQRIDQQRNSQRIYENEVSSKGGHTRNYTEAARAAYRELCKELTTILNGQIRE